MTYSVNRQAVTRPVPVPRTIRTDNKRVITSGDAGFDIPVAAIPILREDGLQSTRLDIGVIMGETADKLANGVHLVAEANFVPKFAQERFKSIDQFNRSFAGQPTEDGGATYVNFIETAVSDPTNDVLNKALGVHVPTGETYNDDYIRSYNILQNWKRKNRSKSLPLRDETDGTLARCFWHDTQMKNIVPSFDTQQVHGDVPITIASGGAMDIRGLAVGNTQAPDASPRAVKTSDKGDVTWEGGSHTVHNGADNPFYMLRDANGFPSVYAELEASGITLSLANIEMAKQTQAWAQIRSRYQGIDDEFLVDIMMQGIRVPQLDQREPVPLGRASTLFGYQQRYATDYANLDKSMTSGVTGLQLNIAMPPSNVGGVILVTVAITPEQLYERQKDYYLYTKSVDDFPNAMLDILDPEKVEIVDNAHPDVTHTDPTGLFGYAPLNHGWMRNAPNIGGKFFRYDPQATWDEDRNRFWAPETIDPELTEDFYLCTSIPKDIFADANVDSFEIQLRGNVKISGRTVFGSLLREATDDYEDIMSQIDQTRIEQTDPAPVDGEVTETEVVKDDETTTEEETSEET